MFVFKRRTSDETVRKKELSRKQVLSSQLFMLKLISRTGLYKKFDGDTSFFNIGGSEVNFIALD
ncbi:hypothetical protein CD32_20410 [Lysinibacillus odysseyi 34hs-1 = NBRC 100172]|uniref:Uncharacterized protein n=1 Tax=Lysinibacillus odysseyi 34hs-1 = NBRC 100172 TaxID=1220589 RepID=A0A0A3IE35_9BACI|nr:hypothetical protein CD32_20410 [Lysinibacillus odysseyi 34hs-1 = NBRC 100172]